MTESNHFQDWDLSHWQYYHGKPEIGADFKSVPTDFIVTEKLGFELAGEGENLFLLIEKEGLNTQQVCEYLAKFFGKRLRDIGYAGLKDKQSVSRQWFSVQMNVTQAVNLDGLNTEQIRLIEHTRHLRKLKVGALKGNHFSIRLRNVTHMAKLEQRLELIKNSQVPNYFGLQRFGFKGNNLNWANRMADGEQIRDKKIKGFALSAARSFLFNEVVSERIKHQIFLAPQVGEAYILAGSNSYFSQQADDTIYRRLQQGDIQLSAPLFGDGDAIATGPVSVLEQNIMEQHQNWCDLLIENGLKQERRPISLIPGDMRWQKEEGNMVCVEFELPAGAFATSVLRECVNFN
mgnify:FL=1